MCEGHCRRASPPSCGLRLSGLEHGLVLTVWGLTPSGKYCIYPNPDIRIWRNMSVRISADPTCTQPWDTASLNTLAHPILTLIYLFIYFLRFIPFRTEFHKYYGHYSRKMIIIINKVKWRLLINIFFFVFTFIYTLYLLIFFQQSGFLFSWLQW